MMQKAKSVLAATALAAAGAALAVAPANAANLYLIHFHSDTAAVTGDLNYQSVQATILNGHGSAQHKCMDIRGVHGAINVGLYIRPSESLKVDYYRQSGCKNNITSHGWSFGGGTAYEGNNPSWWVDIAL